MDDESLDDFQPEELDWIEDAAATRSEDFDFFEYDNSTCFFCEGYYGPCFGQPVCQTCHIFLYPEDVDQPEDASLFSQKSDSEDSGNDEPSDLVLPPLPNALNGAHVDADAENDSGDELPSNSNSRPGEEEGWGVRRLEPGAAQIAPVPPQRPILKIDKLAEQISLLCSIQEQRIPDIKTTSITALPPEVLLSIFSHLDGLSLLCASRACKHWGSLLKRQITPSQWQTFTLKQWPLLQPRGVVHDWDQLFADMVDSAPCLMCMTNMALNTDPTHVDIWRRNRLKRELRSLSTDPPEGIRACPLDGLCCHWQATIAGPANSPYEGGVFYLHLQIPPSYPMVPPVVRFLTRVFHPNVSRHGDIGLDALQHNWSLALTIAKILISVQSLLTDPYVHVAMESEPARLYTHDRERYDAIARAWTYAYATKGVLGVLLSAPLSPKKILN